MFHDSLYYAGKGNKLKIYNQNLKILLLLSKHLEN